MATLKVISGFDCVSFGMISIDALFILLIARRVDFIIDCPISEFLPVNGTRRPILILLFAFYLYHIFHKYILSALFLLELHKVSLSIR